MASVRARTLVKAPRRVARWLRIENQVSTWFNQLDPMGVKRSWMRRCRAGAGRNRLPLDPRFVQTLLDAIEDEAHALIGAPSRVAVAGL